MRIGWSRPVQSDADAEIDDRLLKVAGIEGSRTEDLPAKKR